MRALGVVEGATVAARRGRVVATAAAAAGAGVVEVSAHVSCLEIVTWQSLNRWSCCKGHERATSRRVSAPQPSADTLSRGSCSRSS